jgi:curli biogenesis system outer membrane secretion channel CsgG
MHSVVIAACLGVMMAAGSVSAHSAIGGIAWSREARESVVVVPFETERTTWMPPVEFGATVADLVAHAFAASGRYRVLDREWLGDPYEAAASATMEPVSREHRAPSRPAASGRVPVSVWRALADRTGVRYLVTGAITRFSSERGRRSIGAGALSVLTLGGYRRDSTTAAVEIAMRMIDLETGEVVRSTVTRGTSGRRNLSVGAMGLLSAVTRSRLPLAGGLYSRGSTATNEAMFHEALAAAVERGAGELIGTAPIR